MHTPLISINFFNTRIFVKSWKFFHEYFRYCEAKQLRRKTVVPPLLSLTLLDTRKFLKKRRVPIRSSSGLWDQKYFTRSRDNPSPLLFMRFFVTKSFLKPGRVILRNFTFLCDTVIRREIAILHLSSLRSPPHIQKSSLIPKFFQSRERFVYEFFRCCELKQLWGKMVTPPLWHLTIVDNRFFWKHRRLYLRNFLLLWDNKISTDFHETPSSPLSIPWSF